MSMQNSKNFLKLLFAPYPKVKGECHSCGECCRKVTLVHGGVEITTWEEFQKLRKIEKYYSMFTPNSCSDRAHLTFSCKHLQNDNLCGIHSTRPKLCRDYPSKAMALRGGELLQKCGYRFVYKDSFEEILKKKKKEL